MKINGFFGVSVSFIIVLSIELLNIINDVILGNNYFTQKKGLKFLTKSHKNVVKLRSGWNCYLACTNCSLDAGFSKIDFLLLIVRTIDIFEKNSRTIIIKLTGTPKKLIFMIWYAV